MIRSLLKCLILTAILLTSACAKVNVKIKEGNENYYWKKAVTLASKVEARHPTLQRHCNERWDQPVTVAVKPEDFPKAFDFPVGGMYFMEHGVVYYHKDMPYVLLHEYIHHITSNYDKRCLMEFSATLADIAVELEAVIQGNRMELRFRRGLR